MGRSEERVELVVREASVEEEGEYPPIRQRAGSLPGGHTRKYRPRTFSQVRFSAFSQVRFSTFNRVSSYDERLSDWSGVEMKDIQAAQES